MPKILRRGSNQKSSGAFFSKIINIIVSGSEMMEIVERDPLNFNKIMEFDGIYEINA